jgi:carboxylesterase
MPAVAIGVTAIAGLAAIAAWMVRRRVRVRFETATHRTLLIDQVVIGAEPLALGSGDRGVLILHGFGDTPQSIRSLATALHDQGWTVRAPRLNGHGVSLRAFTSARADEWLRDARSALAELKSSTTHVALVGQSMGGALATILAAEARVDSMVLLAPYLRLSRRAARIARFHRVVSLLIPYLRSRSEYSILDPDARNRALGKGVTTPRLIHELKRVVDQACAVAEKVRVPTLVIHSPHDPRVAVRDAQEAFAHLGCQVKTLKWASRSGHVLSVDYDRDWVRSEVLGWLEAHTPGA